jgi:GNAT superfamily N-acetyltransferase
MSMEIVPLSLCPHYSPILAHWAYFQWYHERKVSFKAVDSDYRRRSCFDDLPVSWVAMDGDTPVGMVSLKEHDLSSHPHLSPWLSALYVLPLYRRRGIAGSLISKILSNAKDRGFSKVYLFADHRNLSYLSRYYSSRGWKLEEKTVDGEGMNTEIYSKEL